jgi:hypothetical protein
MHTGPSMHTNVVTDDENGSDDENSSDDERRVESLDDILKAFSLTLNQQAKQKKRKDAKRLLIC